MKKALSIIIASFLLLFTFRNSYAQAARLEYVITSFESVIDINKDTHVFITETIVANFNVQKHGIFRIIPITYSANGKTIKARFNLVEVTDENGNPHEYAQSRVGQSINIKIGDPNRTLTGEKIYVIKYELTKILQRFDDHDEFYWNVVGSEWDTNILDATATVVSPHTEINNLACYTGNFRSTQSDCNTDSYNGSAVFTSNNPLGRGNDMTIVVALNNTGGLEFPTKFENTISTLSDNWDYVPAILPLIIMILIWYKKGRDKRYSEGGEYYKPKDKTSEFVPLFKREHLPTVYSPIQGLSPAEVGTIIDEKVDIEDVVAEIIELARLGYVEILKISDKKLFKQAEYAFIDKNKDKKELKDYQKIILKEMFRSTIVHKSVSKTEKLFINDQAKLKKARKHLMNKDYALLSALKNHFYEGLPDFKKKLYKGLAEEGIFDGSPDKVRQKWIFLFGLLVGLSVLSRFYFISETGNIGPLFVTLFTAIPGLALAYFMPRKSAFGYSLYRQIKGLKYYLGKGKWRHDVYEKNLFLEETLPLAVSLGVVDKLAKDMEGLDLKPPSYMTGFSASAFSSDFGNFRSSASSSLVSAPKSSGSSWSGGSGFSGGSSGGGFGGGGGGSW